MDLNGKIAITNVVKVMTGSTHPVISVYPNPVSNGIINLQLDNQPAGNYGIRLLNKSGQVMMQRQVEHAGGSSTEIISLDKYTPRGIYQLEVTKPDGTTSNINVIY